MPIQSKNQKANRGKGQKVRMLDGKEVKPVKYIGTWRGHGRYMTGSVNDQLVCDANGKPLPLRQIGRLEYQ